jgi:O-antigen ligase
MYATILAETGSIGFLGFLIFIFSLLKAGYKKLKETKYTMDKKQKLLLILSTFVGLVFNAAGYELFYWINQYIAFCIITGCLIYFIKDETNIARSGDI